MPSSSCTAAQFHAMSTRSCSSGRVVERRLSAAVGRRTRDRTSPAPSRPAGSRRSSVTVPVDAAARDEVIEHVLAAVAAYHAVVAVAVWPASAG